MLLLAASLWHYQIPTAYRYQGAKPELKEKLSRPELRQLAQRITARYHLSPLTRKEVEEYVTHRLTVAGSHKKLIPSACLLTSNGFRSVS